MIIHDRESRIQDNPLVAFELFGSCAPGRVFGLTLREVVVAEVAERRGIHQREVTAVGRAGVRCFQVLDESIAR